MERKAPGRCSVVQHNVATLGSVHLLWQERGLLMLLLLLLLL